MKILIADDHPLFRDAFKGILLQICTNAKISEVGSFDELMRFNTVEQFSFDIVFIDLMMPKGDLCTTINHLSQLNPNTPIIVVSGEEGSDNVRKAINSGASGFLPKSLDTEVLINNLRHILSSSVNIVTTTMKEDAATSSIFDRLTNRQTQVLELMCDGKTNKMIARDLGLSEGTVKLHVRAILQALGADNRTQAVSFFKHKQQP